MSAQNVYSQIERLRLIFVSNELERALIVVGRVIENAYRENVFDDLSQTRSY